MDKVTRQCPQTTTVFEEKGEPKRYPTEVLPLTSLTPYRQAKPAHTLSSTHLDFYWRPPLLHGPFPAPTAPTGHRPPSPRPSLVSQFAHAAVCGGGIAATQLSLAVAATIRNLQLQIIICQGEIDVCFCESRWQWPFHNALSKLEGVGHQSQTHKRLNKQTTNIQQQQQQQQKHAIY